jgi:hypothetical protein
MSVALADSGARLLPELGQDLHGMQASFEFVNQISAGPI